MKKLVKLAAVVTIFSFIVGCAMAMGPVNGVIYQDVKGPVAYGQGGSSAKTGEACATSILGILGQGDASVSAAMKNGGITNVVIVDEHSTGILGIYAKYCTIVKGS